MHRGLVALPLVGVTVTALAFTAARIDKKPPTRPSGLNVTNVTPTSMTLNWKPSRDNVGVIGYQVYLDGQPVGTVP